MYLEKCVEYKKKERKTSYEIYSFVRICDRSNGRCKGGNYRFLVILTKNKCSSWLLLRTPSSRLILVSPEILGLFSDGFCTGPLSVSLLL